MSEAEKAKLLDEILPTLKQPYFYNKRALAVFIDNVDVTDKIIADYLQSKAEKKEEKKIEKIQKKKEGVEEE